jgi:hypothetical protein
MYGRLYKKKQENRKHMPNTQKTDVQIMYEAVFFRNYKIAKRGSSIKSSMPGFLHKSGLYGPVNKKLGQKLQTLPGWDLTFFSSATVLKSTKWPFLSLNHTNFELFSLVPQSPTHTCRSDWCKNPGAKYLKLWPL